MNNKFIFLPGLFVLGMLAGIAMMSGRAPQFPADTAVQADTTPAPDMEPSPNPFVSVQTPSTNNRLQVLQNQLDQLSQRVEQLEQHLTVMETEPEPTEEVTAQIPPADTLPVNTGIKSVLTVENLIKAGVDPEQADDILRRKNDIDLKKLELRDRATREHYIGTSRYNRELSALTEKDVSLREEIGDQAYDSYLYASGQSNRVLVKSVMAGSQADLAGIQGGDVILSYDDQNLFGWSELQQATTQGERGEYVNVNVSRDGQLFNIWVPRGPLGVRLGAARLEP